MVVHVLASCGYVAARTNDNKLNLMFGRREDPIDS